MARVSERWAVLLAGGEGRRLRHLAEQLYDDGRPKQFCALLGGRTLIEQTIERTRLFAPFERTVVSVCPEHLRWRAQWETHGAPLLSVQPTHSGTGAATVLALMEIARRDPEATAAIFPADHHVSPESRFVGFVEQAAAWTDGEPNDVVLIGVRAGWAEADYGWLLPQVSTGPVEVPRRVVLLEKPSREDASALLEAGALWNTLVVVVRVRNFLERASATSADWVAALASDAEAGGELPATVTGDLDLSRDLLAQWPEATRVVVMEGVDWMDLGTEARLRSTRGELAGKPTDTPE